MKIKRVTENDLPTLIEFARATFVAAFADQNDPDDFAAYITSAFTLETFKNEFYTEGSFFYFAENGDERIGYFKLNHNKVPQDGRQLIPEFETLKTLKMTELERIYLTENAHGKGVAALIMDEIVELSKLENSLLIWLGVWEYNLKAIKFYQKSGFSKFGEHIFEIGDDPQTDWLMWKKL
jgi:diamine N-acetyltransferase